MPAGGAADGANPGGTSGPFDANGTCTIALHCGHEARLPAADTATFSVRPQFVQENSIFPVAGGDPKVVVMFRQSQPALGRSP